MSPREEAMQRVRDIMERGNLLAHGDDVRHLLAAYDEAVAALAKVTAQRDELIRAKTGKSPDDLLCCNGTMCGCQGVTVREYELHFVDRAIAKQPPAEKAKQEPWQFDYGVPAFPPKPAEKAEGGA